MPRAFHQQHCGNSSRFMFLYSGAEHSKSLSIWQSMAILPKVHRNNDSGSLYSQGSTRGLDLLAHGRIELKIKAVNNGQQGMRSPGGFLLYSTEICAAARAIVDASRRRNTFTLIHSIPRPHRLGEPEQIKTADGRYVLRITCV